MKKILLIAFVCFCQLVVAQSKGTVTGTLTDKELNGEPLPFANVFIKGTSIGGNTDLDGKYTIAVPEGNHTLVFSFVGYQTVEKPITVVAGQTLTVNQEIGASGGEQLEEVKITGTVNKEKESALLLEQKKAVAIQTKIGAQELSKKGVGDVATAVTKTTGVSKQEGSGTIFVRGLGDRYNITTLNGLPLPSNDPTKKNIDLGFFTTDIVEYIGVDKTYSVKNYGDFGGANVNIASKAYTGKGFAQINLESGVNTVASTQSNFFQADGPGFLGFYSDTYPDFPLNNYNFIPSWDRVEGGAPINSSISIRGGDSYEVGENGKLSFFAVGSFENKYSYKEGAARADINVDGLSRRDFNRKTYTYNANTTLMGNLRYKFGRNTLKYNGLFLNNASNSHDDFQGILDAFDNAAEGGAVVQRQTFTRNILNVHQLLGEHKIGDRFKVEWGGSYNLNENLVPDRRQSTVLPNFNGQPDGPKSFRLLENDGDNHRFYSDFEEREIAANASISYNFLKNDDDEFAGKLRLGFNGRFKSVAFAATQFNFAIRDNDNQPFIDNVYDLDSYFNQNSLNAGLFVIKTFRGGLEVTTLDVLKPQTFSGDQNINAAYLTFEYKFSDAFTGIFGVRGENIAQQFIEFDTSVSSGSSELEKFVFLPSVSLKYVLNDEHNLKFAASKTYTLPQFIERAEFLFEDITGTILGNRFLTNSDNYNADIKWEYFPEKDEIISFGVFGKYIENPINEVGINSASNDISFVNTGDWGYAAGGELEVKKTLFNNETDTEDKVLNDKLSFGVNASYMFHEQELNEEKIVAENPGLSVNFGRETDGFAGASDFLINTDLSYLKDFSKDRSIQATLLFNYFSDRIFALGTTGGTGGTKIKGNLVDQGYGTLDFVFKTSLNKNLSFGISAKNLLNPTVTRIQDIQNVVVDEFKKGIDLKASVSYSF